MGGYSSSSGGSPGSGGTKRQAKSFAKKNKPTPVRDFILGGGITGAVVRGIKKGIETGKSKRINTKLIGTSDYQGDVEGKKSKVATRDYGDDNRQPQGIELAKASTTSSTILSPEEIQKKAANTIKGPTSLEMSADEILLANKRKGRKVTQITSPTGLTKDYKLSKRTLLG